MLLLVSAAADPTSDLLENKFEQSRIKYVRLNREDMSWTVRFDGRVAAIVWPGKSQEIPVSAVVIRRLLVSETPKSFLADQDPGVAEFSWSQLSQTRLAILRRIAEQIFVMNNPQRAVEVDDKLHQLVIAQECGLSIPATCLGSDPVAAEKFARDAWRGGRQVCTKLFAPENFTVQGQQYARMTELLGPDDVAKITSVQCCPLILQEYVPKKFEYRVVVVGDAVLACKIDSQRAGGKTAIDWRNYNLAKTPHEIVTLPDTISAKLIAFHVKTGLVFSCFDLIQTPDDDYVFLETNPFGQWLWLEELVGLPVSDAICKTLHVHTSQ